MHPIKQVNVTLGSRASRAGYQMKVSSDGSAWTTVATVATRQGGFRRGPAGATGRRIEPTSHEVDARGRYVRVEFTGVPADNTASVREIAVYQSKRIADYYNVTYKYRLRWDDVTYEPGELKAVADKAGKMIGEKVVKTAGPAASIRLTPDRSKLNATGEELSFILVEALDAQGNPAPLAANLVELELEGPGEIAAIDNGDQTSYEPFQDSRHKLFYGKAVLIVRTKEAQPGRIVVNGRAQGLKTGTAALIAE